MPIRVLHVGLGPIGLGVVRQVAGRKGLTAVGAVDLDPGKVGRDLGDIAELGRKLRLKVQDDVDAAIRATKPDVAILCTSSSIARLVPQVAAIVKRRVPIVSTTEELAYPTKARRRFAPADRRAGEEGQGRGPRHRRQPRLRDGCPADHADRRLRVGAARARRPHPGRADPPPAVPAEDRLGPDAGSVPGPRRRRDRAPRRPGRVDHHDRRRPRLDARSGDRRHRAEDRRGADREPVPHRRGRPGLRPDPGRRRLSRRRAGDHAAHGGLPRGARVRTTRCASRARRPCA